MARGAIPLRFETFESSAEFTVHFTLLEYSATEVWYVGGSCNSIQYPAPIFVTDLAYVADMTIYITKNDYAADRVVCIVNKDAAPAGFWTAYEAAHE